MFLTAPRCPGGRVVGQEAGGDDYLVRPFASVRSLARITALGRVVRPLACVLALGAGGCSLVPNYVRPQVNVAASWTGPADATGPGVQARAGWWHSFGSSELDQLMARGLTGNLNLQAAIARIAQARGTAEIDAAPLWPAVSLVGTQDQNTGIKNSRTTSCSGRRPTRSIFGAGTGPPRLPDRRWPMPRHLTPTLSR